MAAALICKSCGEPWTSLEANGICYDCNVKAQLTDTLKREAERSAGFETIRCPHCKGTFLREWARGKRPKRK